MFDQFGVSLVDRLLKHSQPYRNQWIIRVICDMYFIGGMSSFARRFNNLFLCYYDHQGVMKPEVLDQMVALVVSAVCSSCSVLGNVKCPWLTCNIGVCCHV